MLTQPHDPLVHNTKNSHHHIPTDQEWHARTHAVDSQCTGQLWCIHCKGWIQFLTVREAEQMQDFTSAACTRFSIVHYAHACYLSALVHAAVVSMFVTACGRDDDASNISQHHLPKQTLAYVTAESIKSPASQPVVLPWKQWEWWCHKDITIHIVTARSTIQLWPVFLITTSGRTEQTTKAFVITNQPHNPLHLCKYNTMQIQLVWWRGNQTVNVQQCRKHGKLDQELFCSSSLLKTNLLI